MSAQITTDVVALVAEKTGLTFDIVFRHVQAQVMGFIQRRSWFGLNAAANTIILAYPTPDQRIKPLLQASLMRIDVEVSFSGTAPKMFVRTYDSQAERNEQVLGGAAFTTKVSKSFDKQMKAGESYNFYFDQDCLIEYMKFTEILVSS